MNERSRSFLDSLVYPVALGVLAPVAGSVGSRLSTGAWWTWLRAVPPRWWWAIGIVLATWVVVVLVRRRLAALRAEDGGMPVIQVSGYAEDYVPFGTFVHLGVHWIVKKFCPEPERFIRDPRDVDPSDVEVRTPPRCPRCKTELEEERAFLGGYRWFCVGCGFSKRNQRSFLAEGARAQRLARRHVELLLEKRTV